MTKECFTREILAMTDTLYGVSRTYLHQDADCADAVQESILKAWVHLASLKKEAYFRTWVIRILINECKSMCKRKRRMVPVAQFPDTIAPPGPDNGLYAVLLALDEKYRIPLVLYHCEGYAVEEIARILRLPKGTVLSRLFRGREKLRQDFAAQEVCLYEG